MEIVEPVEKVGEPSSEERQHIAIAILAQETKEEAAHALKKLVIIAAQDGEGFFGNSAEELLWVHLKISAAKKKEGWSGIIQAVI